MEYVKCVSICFNSSKNDCDGDKDWYGYRLYAPHIVQDIFNSTVLHIVSSPIVIHFVVVRLYLFCDVLYYTFTATTRVVISTKLWVSSVQNFTVSIEFLLQI